MRAVNQPIRKKDAMQLLTGQPAYTDDFAPSNALIVKLLRSPHPNAIIEDINTDIAMKVPGMVAVFTWKDVPADAKRFTCAGASYPEWSPYDRLIMDRQVRFAGDTVAIVAGETEAAVDRALKCIKVKYQVLEPVMDYHTALDNPILVHPEDNWNCLVELGADNRRNSCYHEEESEGDIEAVLADCDVVIDHTFHTKACQQAMLEPFTTYCTIDHNGRLNVVSSTQIVFHCRHIVANALCIRPSQVRVIKPRIGGGFGAKQTSVSEIYPAFVTWKTKRPSKIIFTRTECMIASSPRHEMEISVRLGADNNGHIRAIDMRALSNAGAYGEHSPTTVGLAGHKSISLYGKLDAFRFIADVVYTNHQSSGAYRGFGATQGQFAVESCVNELAHKLNMDPFTLREMNMTREGQLMPSYFSQINTSCALDRCLTRVKEMIRWDEKYPVRDLGNGKIRAVGMAMSMQGSGISNVDVGSAHLRLNEEGTFTLKIGAADMGTGCDTTLPQVAAEVLECSVDDISVYSGDTDAVPYDSGSYASSTAYVTGKATELCARNLLEKIRAYAAGMLNCAPEEVSYAEGVFSRTAPVDGEKNQVTLREIGLAATCFNNMALEAIETHSSPLSPPPFMVGAVELEIDTLTGETKVVEFDAAVDCGTPLNPNLVRVQAEGGLLQGIGMALTENIQYNDQGMPRENSYMQYKIPSRLDVGKINVVCESSYEESGPFGAKSIGEVVLNTPLGSIADAVYNATGHRFCELPITPEQIAMHMKR